MHIEYRRPLRIDALVITIQYPVDHWHAFLGDPTIADAILDRMVHAAYYINLKGHSLRKGRSKA